MEHVVDALGRERLLLELLVFRLVELRQLLVAGEGRFLGWAGDEVERACRSVRQAEIARAVLVSSYAEELGVTDDCLDLTALMDRADEPWRTILADHGDALRALAAEADGHAAAIRRLSRAAGRTLAASLQGRH